MRELTVEEVRHCVVAGGIQSQYVQVTGFGAGTIGGTTVGGSTSGPNAGAPGSYGNPEPMSPVVVTQFSGLTSPGQALIDGTDWSSFGWGA